MIRLTPACNGRVNKRFRVNSRSHGR